MFKAKSAWSVEYGELLRDPRWQKKRLEVMDRDGFACQICGDKTTTLNVHHRYYILTGGSHPRAPWDYPMETFVTLCEPCHKREGDAFKPLEQMIIRGLKRLFFSRDLFQVSDALNYVDLDAVDSAAVAEALAWAIRNPSLLIEAHEKNRPAPGLFEMLAASLEEAQAKARQEVKA